MSDWIAGLISGIAGGGKEMARQAETTLDEISKSRLRAFDLNEDRQTRAADWTNRKMESLEERTSREKENQAQREFQGKHNEAVLALQRQQLDQQAGHNAASLALQQQQLEEQIRQHKNEGTAIVGDDGNQYILRKDGSITPVVKTEQSQNEGWSSNDFGGTGAIPTTTTPFKPKGEKTTLADNLSFQTTKLMFESVTEQMKALNAQWAKPETTPEEQTRIAAKLEELTVDRNALIKLLTAKGDSTGEWNLPPAAAGAATPTPAPAPAKPKPAPTVPPPVVDYGTSTSTSTGTPTVQMPAGWTIPDPDSLPPGLIHNPRKSDYDVAR